MSYAPSNTNFAPHGDDTALGSFNHKDTDAHFDFTMDFGDEDRAYPHKVWVCNGYRMAKVLKTVAYVIVDEDEKGPIIEKWAIKNWSDHRAYHGMDAR